MNEVGKRKNGNPPRRPLDPTGPMRSQKRIDNEADQSGIDRFRQGRSAEADAPAVDHGRIAELAYAIWQQRGCPPGQDTETWREAEAQLQSKPSR
ncbi:MAG TPA: DUF2934 domain-containing protein [Polyangia bacterium]|nr:DUF2934 domain-containing protein [Polyangia bacterium]